MMSNSSSSVSSTNGGEVAADSRPTATHTDDLVRLQQQYFDIFSPTTKPVHQAVDTRKFAEAICRRLFAQAMGREPDKAMTLDGYFEAFKNRKLPLEYIYPQLETIQKLGNYAGHDQRSVDPITATYVQPALAAVDVLMNWYVHTQLQQPHLQFAKGQLTHYTPPDAIVTESNDYELEMVGGAIPLESKFYIQRPVDKEFQAAIARRDSIVLLKGPWQVGKTSLLARGLQQAREKGIQVLLTDFQKLIPDQLQSLETLFLALGDMLADQLNLAVYPQDKWRPNRAPNMNFDSYFRREIMGNVQSQLLWAMDEVNCLLDYDFSNEVFALFRTWHNERALTPESPFSRLTMAISTSESPLRFIKDSSHSPFNVGTKLLLEDFTLDQVADLNQRYGLPLQDAAELQRFYQLVGGQPYLVRCGLNEIVQRHLTMDQFIRQADQEDGVFGDHLRRVLMLVKRDPHLCDAVREALHNQPCPDDDSFSLLRRVGILKGDCKDAVGVRCEIYATYLRKHLL